jgi:hypothetical protein
MIQVARKHDDFSDAETEQFQDLADNFFLGWIKLHKGDGVTNYIHMLGSGHFQYNLGMAQSVQIFPTRMGKSECAYQIILF